MWDFSLSRSMQLLVRTAPFLLLRLAVYFGITLAYILVTAVGAGVGWGVGALGSQSFQAGAAFWGGLTGFVLVSVFMYWAREYILYLVKAGHIAVLVALLDDQPLPQGQSQFAYGTTVVKERFAQASVLFAIDQLVRGVLRAIVGLVRGMFNLLPLPGVKQLMGLLHAFLRVAIGFVDEVILAHAIRTRSDDGWASARDALILYGQNYRVMLKNAAWLTVFIYLLSFLVFLVMLAPAAAIVWLMPGGWSAGALVFAVLLAWSVKASLLDPFAIVCLMQVYFRTVEGQQPDPEWEARLEQMSGKFRELKARAAATVTPAPAPAAGAEATAAPDQPV